MANLVFVDVDIFAKEEALRQMETKLRGVVRLKEVLDRQNVPDVEGRVLDNRTHIEGLKHHENLSLHLFLQQPWNVNIGRLERWAKMLDDRATVLFYANYADEGEYTTNDKNFLAEHPGYFYEGI